MDICLRRPLIVTCSNDKTIRVWNYEENILECSHTFSEDLLSVAFHPSGFHIAVGSDKLRLMNLHIVHNNNNPQIRMFKEIGIKGCKEVRFSHGGQYFAATLGTNNQNHHPIYVYRFYTGEDPPHLQFRVGHHGRIRCLEWSKVNEHSL
jgi:WD40 repeat protein